MNNRFLALACIVTAATLSAGCGKLTDSQQKDISSLVGGLTNSRSKPPVDLKADLDTARTQGFYSTMRDQFQGALWLARFKARAVAQAGSTQSIAVTGCTASSFSSDGISCDVSCPSSTSVKLACSGTTSDTATCGTTTFTFANPSFSLVYDLANVTGSSLSSATGTFDIALSFAANVSGGSFDGKKLACSIGFSFDISKAMAETDQTPTLSCEDFSCTYDGIGADCSTVQSNLGSESCS